MSKTVSAISAKVGAEKTSSGVMSLRRAQRLETSDGSAGRTRVVYLSSSSSFLGQTKMAPNSHMCRIGNVVSTSKNTISDLS